MKKSIIGLASILLALNFTACKSETAKEETGTEGTEEQICFYSYNEGSTELTWTAFKTPEKVGVSGSFNEIQVESENSDDKMVVLESLSFKMNTASVESNNEDRNGKIADKFFGTINTPEITGRVKSIGDDGKAIIAISMNGVEKDVEGDYTLEDNTFSYTTTIHLEDWNALDGVAALNEECHSLHMTDGKGESKLWSEVDLSFTTTLASDCDN